jgi:hypothetical protein
MGTSRFGRKRLGVRAFDEGGTRRMVDGDYHAYGVESCPFDMLIARP